MRKLDFYTFYHQFYIADIDCPGSTDGDFWNDEASSVFLDTSIPTTSL